MKLFQLLEMGMLNKFQASHFQIYKSVELSEEDLKFHGPLVVIKVIAVYP